MQDNAYLLHRRPYRETSCIAQALTREHGVIAFVARGVTRNSGLNAKLLQPFIPLTIYWQGDGELVSMREVEASGNAFALTGKALICGLYLNELLYKILAKWDVNCTLYEVYAKTLASLATNSDLPLALRLFEKQLIESLGYAFTNINVDHSEYYSFNINDGLMPATATTAFAISEAGLQSLSSGVLDNKIHRQEARAFLRSILEQILAGKKINSRALV